MKIIFGIFVVLNLLYSFDYHLKGIKITKDITCFFGKNEKVQQSNGGHIANCCFVTTKDGFVVIDSGPTYMFAKQAYEYMANSTPLKIKYVINTHKHDDHWLANCFYKEKGATIIGSKSIKDSVGKDETTRIQREVSSDAFAKTKVVYPDEYVEKERNIKVGQKLFLIKQLSPIAHSDGDLIVYIPNEVIFTGDLVFEDRLLSLRDGDINGWLEALAKISNLNWKVLVPGHGSLKLANESLKGTRGYLQELKDEVSKALDKDVEFDEITKVVTLSKYKNLAMYDILNKRNILKAYQLLELEDEE